MSYPQAQDTVVLVFTGRLDNGEIFITSDKDAPLKAIIGNSNLPPTLEGGIVAMKIGETRKIRVPPEEGFGERQKELLQTIDNQGLVDTLHPKPGMIVTIKVDKDGTEQQIPATVMSVDGPRVTVDYNHPLAGHHLTYEVTLLDIAKPPRQGS
jgi:FKBP-type peptidyl-prolyl cis-trans isomerase SlpA